MFLSIRLSLITTLWRSLAVGMRATCTPYLLSPWKPGSTRRERRHFREPVVCVMVCIFTLKTTHSMCALRCVYGFIVCVCCVHHVAPPGSCCVSQQITSLKPPPTLVVLLFLPNPIRFCFGLFLSDPNPSCCGRVVRNARISLSCLTSCIKQAGLFVLSHYEARLTECFNPS